MHLPTHVLSGWVAASCFPNLTPRERALAMAAATAADLDGLAIIAGREAYETYHHVVGHNLLFGLLVAAAVTAWSTHRRPMALLGFGLFHLHLVMDSFGSGRDWGISYLWPVVQQEWVNPWRWSFFSWQNMVAAYGLVLVTVVLAIRQGRTPLETLALDAGALDPDHVPDLMPVRGNNVQAVRPPRPRVLSHHPRRRSCADLL